MCKPSAILAGVAVIGLLGSCLAYDLHTRELTPIVEKARPSGAPMRLVENGELRFAIVTDKTAEKMTGKINRTGKSIEPAVADLVKAFEWTTGKMPEIIDENETEKLARYPYWLVVGDSKLARTNGIDVTKLPTEGFVIKSFERGLVIAGRDTSLVEGYGMKPLSQETTGKGTYNGAIDFIERFLGVRFYFPGNGIWKPACVDLVVEPVWYEDAPYFAYRGDGYWPYESTSTKEKYNRWKKYMGENPYGLEFQKTPSFLRFWRIGGVRETFAGHCPFPDRMLKSHPDKIETMFYRSPCGKLWMNREAHIGNYWNVLDLKFADLLVEDYRRLFNSDGKDDPGGYRSACGRKMLSFGVCDTFLPYSDMVNHPVVQELNLIAESDIKRDADAALANVYGRFFQYLGNRVGKEFPGTKLGLLIYYNAKCASLDPRWRLPNNVEVNVCDGRLPKWTRSPQAMEKSKQLFREWYEALGNRPVTEAWLYNGMRENPFERAISAEYIGDVPKVLGRYFGRGRVFFDNGGGWDYWHSYYAMYAGTKSQWNPDFDVEAAIDAHWKRLYGEKPGECLRKFHKILRAMHEETFCRGEEEVPLYPVELVAKAEQLLDEGRAALLPGSEEEKRYGLVADYFAKGFKTQKARAAYETPVHNVRKLEGYADDAFWADVAGVELMNPTTGSKTFRESVAAKFAWDEKGVYMRLTGAFDPLANEKADIWGNTRFELFISPGLKKEVKYQVAGDVLGRTFSQMQRKLPIEQPSDLDWDHKGFRSTPSVGRDGWRIDAFLPFAGLGTTPRAYDQWNANFVYTKGGSKTELAGNSLTLGNHHNMVLWGIFRFLGKGDR